MSARERLAQLRDELLRRAFETGEPPQFIGVTWPEDLLAAVRRHWPALRAARGDYRRGLVAVIDWHGARFAREAEVVELLEALGATTTLASLRSPLSQGTVPLVILTQSRSACAHLAPVVPLGDSDAPN